MSLAIYAAPFNNDVNENNDIINKKKQSHSKTQKMYPKENINSEKVNSILEEIHNNSNSENENENDLGDYKSAYNFNPPPKPKSAGVDKTIATEQMQNMTNDNNINMLKTLGKAPNPNYDNKNNLDLNNVDINYGNIKSNEEFYNRMLPNYKKSLVNKQYYNNLQNESASSDILLQKLNYMINLIEEQQDEKTNNVTEEVVLYFFLGIFIIFIVDSFSRVGKYIR
jgi:hypothetical protein